MPTFLVPLYEANDCHSPAGSPAGGQFCAKGGAGHFAKGGSGLGPGHFARLDTMPLADLQRSLASHKASLPTLRDMGAGTANAETLIAAMEKALAKRGPAKKSRVGVGSTGHFGAIY